MPSDVSRGLDGSARLWVITKCPYGIRSENHVACHGGKAGVGELRVAGKSRTGTPAGNHFPHRLHLPPDAFDMKTFCEVCTAKPATLVCCADDAVMCDSCDARCASLLKKKKEDGRRLRSNSPRAPRKRGASKTRRRADDSPGGAIESSPTANRNARGPLAVADLAPLPPVSYLPRSIHSANPVVAKHERVAFKANSTKPLCDICQVRSRDHRSKRIVASLARRRARSRPDFPPRAAPRDAFAGATCPRVSRLFTAAGSDRPLGQMGGY